MAHSTPRVSIGLPVYNGENFLEEAIASIRAQTFEDWELILSDNASTDATPRICRRYAALDSRIRVRRNAENVGAAANYTCAFRPARGTYFKWAAHDDLLHPEYLAACVDALDRRPDAVTCTTVNRHVDAEGEVNDTWGLEEALDDPRPHVRLRAALTIPLVWMSMWGVHRREAVAQTDLLGPHVAHDRTFVANMALHGAFVEVDRPLFQFRHHEGQSVHTHSWRRPRAALRWYDPAAGQHVFPAWREWREYGAAVARTPMPLSERLRCYAEVARWGWAERFRLRQDAVVGGMQGAPGLRWLARVDPVARVLRATLPDDAHVILVDQEQLEVEVFEDRRIVPFTERKGMYWGPPADDAHALRELNRLRADGAEFMVVAWPAFWWLDYYTGFREVLETRFRRLAHTRRFIIFDLRTGA